MKVKWGVIGCGGIADRRMLPGMMLSESVELIAVMDANKDAALKCKEKYGAKYAFDNEEELLKLEQDTIDMYTADLNATKEELSSINGISETIAEKIIEYRETNGEYKTLEEIMNVSGIGTKTYEKIRDFITLR